MSGTAFTEIFLISTTTDEDEMLAVASLYFHTALNGWYGGVISSLYCKWGFCLDLLRVTCTSSVTVMPPLFHSSLNIIRIFEQRLGDWSNTNALLLRKNSLIERQSQKNYHHYLARTSSHPPRDSSWLLKPAEPKKMNPEILMTLVIIGWIRGRDLTLKMALVGAREE